jgi:hypothetical protein
MKGKVLFVAGLAVGYVLGTRDGRRRYEQIKAAAANIWESEPVQWGAAQAREAMGDVADKAISGAKKAIHQATAKDNIDKPAAKRPAVKRPSNTRPAAAASSATASPVTKPIPTVEPSARSRQGASAKPAASSAE